MAISFNPYVAALYVLGPPLGFFVVGLCMAFMRRTSGLKRVSLKWIDFWLGTSERYVAMLLFAYRADQLPWFIGAWVSLKFAANWKRHRDPDAQRASLLFLVGNVLSFGFAIALALLAQRLSGG